MGKPIRPPPGPPGPNRDWPPGVDFSGAAPTGLSYRLEPAELLIETARDSNQWEPSETLEWASITDPLDGEDFTCQLSVRGFDVATLYNADGTLNVHFASILEQLTGDRRVRVSRSIGAVDRRVLFQGYPQPIHLQSTPERQAMTITCLSEGQEWLRHGPQAGIEGRYLRRDAGQAWDPSQPDHKLVRGLEATFNPQGIGNRSAEAYEFGGSGTTIKLHLWTADDDETAERWTYAQALRTLAYLYVYVHAGPVSVLELLADTTVLSRFDPLPDSPYPWVTKLTAWVDSVSVQSLMIDDAFTLLCDRAGLHYHVAVRSAEGEGDAVIVDHFVRILAARETRADRRGSGGAHMRLPEVHDIPRMRPLADLTAMSPRDIAIEGRCSQFDVTVDPRSINEATYLGGREEYEVSCLLRPGWEPDAAHHLDDLDVSPGGVQLSPSQIIANRKAAHAWWADQFEADFDDTGAPLVTSRYDRRHRDHVDVADVMRLWIFPDDPLIDATALGRKGGVWGAQKYQPYQDAVGRPLWYDHWTYGGGLLHTATQHWTARRRPFGDTIGRRNQATTDRAPIVRIHHGMPVVQHRHDDLLPLTIRISTLVYEVGGTAYRLTPAEPVVMTDDAVNYVYALAGGVFDVNTEGFPDTDHLKLAEVSTTGGAIIQIAAYEYGPDVPDPHDDGWQEFVGDVTVLEDRAGLHVGENDIYQAACVRRYPDNPNDDNRAVDAYIDGHLWIQITATVVGDDRMWVPVAESGGSGGRARAAVIDLGYDEFQVRMRRGASAGNSYLASLAADGPEYENRDDHEALILRAHAIARNIAGDVAAGNYETLYLDDTVWPGDGVSGCRALGLGFSRYPIVTMVQHLGGPSQRTQVILSDARENPEVGSE